MSSSASRRIFVVIAVLLIGVLAGWFFLSRPPVAAKPTDTAQATRAADPVAATANVSDAVAPVSLKSQTPLDETRRLLDEARSVRNPVQRSLEFGRRFQELVARDPAAALAYLRELKSGAEYTQGLLMVLEAVGRTDPDRALALAKELVSTREQRAIYSILFAQMAASDPQAAAVRIGQVPAGDSRTTALRALADGWAQTDLAAAVAWAQKLGEAGRAPAMEAVLATMLTTDPVHAIDLAQQTLTGAAFERTLVAALQTLTMNDPKAAAALVSTLAPGAVQTQAALAVARALAAQSPTEALAWTKTLPAGDLSRMTLNNILDVWAAKDPVAAGQYVVQMGAGPEQEAAAGYLATLLAKNPNTAISWAQSLGDAPARDAALVNLASAWAQSDPAAAARWAGSLAAPDVRAQALNGALSYWVMQDSAAAQNFIFGLTGETQASAAAHLAPTLAQRDPVATVAWTQTLPTPEAREAALISAYARWLANAPNVAQAWLAGANIPAATKARLAGQP